MLLRWEGYPIAIFFQNFKIKTVLWQVVNESQTFQLCTQTVFEFQVKWFLVMDQNINCSQLAKMKKSIPDMFLP